jgi:hypothetical protein
VRRASALCRELGRPLANSAETGKILGLPPRQRAGSA